MYIRLVIYWYTDVCMHIYIYIYSFAAKWIDVKSFSSSCHEVPLCSFCSFNLFYLSLRVFFFFICEIPLIIRKKNEDWIANGYVLTDRKDSEKLAGISSRYSLFVLLRNILVIVIIIIFIKFIIIITTY